MLPSPTTGSQVRQFNLIRQLSPIHEFTVISFCRDNEENYFNQLRSFCSEVIPVPLHFPPPFGRWKNRIRTWSRLLLDPRPGHILTYPIHLLRKPFKHLLTVQTFDLIQVGTLHPAQIVESHLARQTLLVDENIESSIQNRRYALTKGQIGRIKEWIEWQKLLRYETAQLRRFAAVVTVSQDDARRCKELAPNTPVHVVPNGVDIGWFRHPTVVHDYTRQGLLFVGTMDYAPNIDAALYFCSEIWPVIRERRPDVTLTIAGTSPVPEILALSKIPGVTVTGFVEDLRPYFWNAAVCVVPLRNGGGTRLKILEAMAAELPVVSTTIGAEGLSVKHGTNILIADNPRQFADSITQLFIYPGLYQQIQTQGRFLVERLYDWKIIAQDLNNVYQNFRLSRNPSEP
jgi:glycosyltransferase involved in cell wall biosynthesis